MNDRKGININLSTVLMQNFISDTVLQAFVEINIYRVKSYVLNEEIA